MLANYMLEGGLGFVLQLTIGGTLPLGGFPAGCMLEGGVGDSLQLITCGTSGLGWFMLGYNKKAANI